MILLPQVQLGTQQRKPQGAQPVDPGIGPRQGQRCMEKLAEMGNKPRKEIRRRLLQQVEQLGPRQRSLWFPVTALMAVQARFDLLRITRQRQVPGSMLQQPRDQLDRLPGSGVAQQDALDIQPSWPARASASSRRKRAYDNGAGHARNSSSRWAATLANLAASLSIGQPLTGATGGRAWGS